MAISLGTSSMEYLFNPPPPLHKEEDMGMCMPKKISHFSNIIRRILPRQALMENMSDQITTWNNDGDQLIIMGDLNAHIYSQKVRTYLSKLGLRELIIEKHGTEVPCTTISSKRIQVIDSIWSYQGLTISKVGYLPFNKAQNTTTY